MGWHSRGLFLSSQKVLRSVLLDVLLDLCSELIKVVPIGSKRSYFDSYGIPPSPYPALPRKSSEVPFSSEGGTSQRLGGPDSSHKTPGCTALVLLDVLLDLGVVLLDKIGVVGLLRCASLTLRSRHSKQDQADGVSPLATR